MNLRLEDRDIRIRLSEKEWAIFNETGQVRQKMQLGFRNDLTVNIVLSDCNSYCIESFEVQVCIAKESLQKPTRKKDPYWSYVSDAGVRFSLDVDIIPEEKR
ncbi:hypothetical protein [Bdellovibrio sp.]|uniref:hypothetical protein n=1 Tax=Bdellovibrio TaxID=958 RepID=UPI0032217F96